MPVALNLRTTEMETFHSAMKAANVDFKARSNTVELTADNVYPISNAIKAYRNKKVSIKTKSLPNMEAAFNCQEIEKKITLLLPNFPTPANDTEIGIVVAEPEEKPDLTEERFDTADTTSGDSEQ